MSEKSQATVSVTAEQLQAIMAEVVKVAIAESRRPAEPTEEEKARVEQDKKMRQQQSEQELAIQANRRAEQKRCSHRHANGTSSIAPVEGFSPIPNTNFIICVHCQAKIKPAPATIDEKDQYFYDENLYWSLLSARTTTTF